MIIEKDQISPTVGILSIISVVGCIGNIFVILIYIKRCNKVTSNLFITILAASDTFTCTFIIPSTIYMELNLFQINSSYFCKGYFFFNNSLVPFSALLISLIAVDRYFCICHPFLQAMTLRRSRLFVIIVLSISLFIGTLASFQVHIEMKPVNNSNFVLINKGHCEEVRNWANATLFQQFFYQFTQKSQLISYSTCILIVICLYSMIYYTVLKVRRKKDKLKGINNKKYSKSDISRIEPSCQQRPYICDENPSNYIQNNNNNKPNNQLNIPTNKSYHLEVIETRSELKPLSTNLQTGQTTINPPPSYESSMCTSKRHDNQSLNSNNIDSKRTKNLRDTKLLQNLKLAAMLFVVAITYIVTFLPANLMANEIINLYLPIFYMYYINNAANPIIYCFMNRNFRNELKQLKLVRLFIR